MRVIAGEFRGRRLLAPEGEQTRPVTDRVKQSVFDVLMPYLDGAIVYDCFAGTGSFGIESLSRGASHASFFEGHRPTAKRLLQNLQTLGVESRATVIGTDIFAAMRRVPERKATLVFLDPPYRYLRERPQQLQSLAGDLASHHLDDESLVVFRHDAADSLELTALPVVDVREYGSMTVKLLRRLRA